jgi:hypothetical protein
VSLILPGGPAWGWSVSNLTGTPAAATVGTNFSFGAANADGATVEFLADLAYDCCYLVVGVGGCATTAEDNSALVDILGDPAGGTSYTSAIATDLICGFTPVPAGGTTPIACWYHFPIWIKSGTALAVRARKTGATAATGGRIVAFVFGKPKRPEMWWCGQGIESLGINAGTSKGTAHTPGNTGAYSTYATIGTSTVRYGALQFGAQPSTGTVTAIGYYWQLGVSSAALPGAPMFYQSGSTAEVMARSGFAGPMFLDIPTSTALQVRATASGTAVAHNAAFYGVY